MDSPDIGRDRHEPATATSRTVVATLIVTSVAAFMAFLDVTIVNIAFPSIEETFPGAALSTLSWVLNGYNVVMAAFLALGGRMADALGRRRLFVIGLGVFTAFSVACALSPSVEWLVAMRVGQAVGAAVMIPAAMALLLGVVPAARRATSVAIFAATASFAAGIGPSLGGAIVEHTGWRMVFLINLPIGVLAIVAAYRFVAETPPTGRRLPDLIGAALTAVSIGALALGLVKGPEWGWWSADTVVCFAVAAVGLQTVVTRSRTHPVPVLDLQLLRAPAQLGANVSTLMFASAFFCASLAGVLFLTSVWGYTALEAGLAVSPSPLISAVVAAPAGRIADRFGHRWVIVPGAALFAAGMAMLATGIGAEPDYVAGYLPAALVFGIGVGLAFPALTSAAVDRIPDSGFAMASATNSVARQLGGVLGVSMLIAVFGTPAPGEVLDGFHHVWVAAALVALACIVPVVVCRDRRRTASPGAGGDRADPVPAARAESGGAAA